MDAGVETLLNAHKPCSKGVPPSIALDMSGSPHQRIGYPLRAFPKCICRRVW